MQFVVMHDSEWQQLQSERMKMTKMNNANSEFWIQHDNFCLSDQIDS